ncbi:MAG TPA: universal stress protein [Nocardioides sp.]|uniref:universal stress protein n=1 Tax=Nocardioides sp. TaxID=35761 RepID=UPI002C62B650|nr:universal stress protein [Nocardioides sp.]HTW13898.1 universal stress protein [Nocardioides sp.]
MTVAVDDSPFGAGALHFAASRATRCAAPVRLVYVTPQAATPPGARLHRESLLAALAEVSASAQLLVVGQGSGGGARRVLDDSLIAALPARARCTVAIVPNRWGVPADPGPVVVGVSDLGRCADALSRAFDEADHLRVPIRLLHTRDPEHDPAARTRLRAGDWVRTTYSALTRMVAPLRACHPHVSVELAVVDAGSAEALVAASRLASVLIIGPSSGDLGATARAVLAGSRCPVEFIPSRVRVGLPARHALPPDVTARRPIGHMGPRCDVGRVHSAGTSCR